MGNLPRRNTGCFWNRSLPEFPPNRTLIKHDSNANGGKASFSALSLSMVEESSGMHSSLLYSACHLFPRTTANCMLTNEGGTQSKGLPRERGSGESSFRFC